MNNHFKRALDSSMRDIKWNERNRSAVLERIHRVKNEAREGGGGTPGGFARWKHSTAVILAAVLALSLCVTALAELLHGDFFAQVFGKGVEGQEAYTIVDDGSISGYPKTEHYPSIERVEVDAERAEKLTGEYVSAPNESITVGQYTFTLENALFDQNGIGAFTVHVHNPEGHKLKQSGVYEQKKGESPPFGTVVEADAGEGGFMDCADYLVADSFTETDAVYVYYVTPFEPLSQNVDLKVTFIVFGESDASEEAQAALTVSNDRWIPAAQYSSEGIRASVSPVGLMIQYDFGANEEKIEDQLVLHYRDGSEYVVLGDDLVNMAEASGTSDSSFCWIAFNRLADVEQIADIYIKGTCGDSGEYDFEQRLTRS